MTAPAPARPSTASRFVTSAAKGGCLFGAIGFAGGFFGPMIFAPKANQGPMLGIFFTGPLGLVLGLLIGAIVGWCRRNDPAPPMTNAPSKPRQLWLWLKTGEPGTVRSFVLLIGGILIGILLALWLFGAGMRSRMGEGLAEPLLGITSSAVVWGFIGGLIQPKQAPLWSMGVVMPLLLMAVTGPALLVVMIPLVALNALGVVAGRRLRR